MTKRCKCGSTKFKETKHYTREYIHSTTTGRRSDEDLVLTDKVTFECAKCGQGYVNMDVIPDSSECYHEEFKVEWLTDVRIHIEAEYDQPFSQGIVELDLHRGDKWTKVEHYTEDDQTMVFRITCKECGEILFYANEEFEAKTWFGMEELKEKLIEKLWELPNMKANMRMLFDNDEKRSN
jgi:RNase P subunit RPR2